MLTIRDQRVLDFLRVSGFATISQITRANGFSNESNCRARLKALREYGLVAGDVMKKFPNLRNRILMGKHSLPLALSIAELDRTKVYFIKENQKKLLSGAAHLQNKNMLLHQLVVNHIYLHLKDILKDDKSIKFDFDPDLRSETGGTLSGGAEETITDIRITNKKGLKASIEVELSRKSHSHYFNKIESYERLRYTHVIFYFGVNSRFEYLKDYFWENEKIAFSKFLRPMIVENKMYGELTLLRYLSMRGKEYA